MAVDPVIKAIGDAVVAYYKPQDIILEFSHFSEHRDSLSAELAVTHTLGEIYWGRINMVTPTGRRDVIKALEERLPVEGWRIMVDRACRLVALHHRRGEPEQPMVATPPAEDRWLVPGLIPLHETSIIYADGGSGKSLLALALLISGLTGHALGGPWAVGPIQKAMYLDWESSRLAHEGRLWGLTRHREEPKAETLLHRRLWRPLVDEIADVRGAVAKQGVDVVVADSLAPASGIDPEGANASTTTFNALASLDTTTRIVLAHMSHAGMDTGRPGRPFGSVFNRNLARSAIEIKAEESEDEGALTLTLYHRKMNEGRKRSPSALTFLFEPDGCIDVRRAEPDQAGASLGSQILDALRGGSQTVSSLAEHTGKDEASIRMTLNREVAKGNRSKVIRFERSEGGKGKESQWGLRDTNRIIDHG